MDQIDLAARLLTVGRGITFHNELSGSALEWIEETDKLLSQICPSHLRYQEFLKYKAAFLQARDMSAFEEAKSKILNILTIFAHAWDFMKTI